MNYKLYLNCIFALLFITTTAKSYDYTAIIELSEFQSQEAKNYIDESIAKIKAKIINNIFILKDSNVVEKQYLESLTEKPEIICTELTEQHTIKISYKVNSKIEKKSLNIEISNNNDLITKEDFDIDSYKGLPSKKTAGLQLVNTIKAYRKINAKIETFFNTAHEKMQPDVSAAAIYSIIPVKDILSDFNLRLICLHKFKSSR